MTDHDADAATRIEHDWKDVPRTRGPNKGKPSGQRRCENCGLWETELSRATPCPPPASHWESS